MEKTVRYIALFLLGLFLALSTFSVGIQTFENLSEPFLWKRLSDLKFYSHTVFAVVGLLTVWYVAYPHFLRIYFLDTNPFWQKEEGPKRIKKLKENLKEYRSDHPIFFLIFSVAGICALSFFFVFIYHFVDLKKSLRIFLPYCLTLWICSTFLLSGISFLIYHTWYFKEQVKKIEKPWLSKPQEFLR